MSAEIEKLTFEQAVEEMETIVNRLERGEIPLAEAVNLYEKGDKLKNHCKKLLEAAEKKFEKIITGPNGEIELEDAE